MLNNAKRAGHMPLIHMTPEQVTNRLITERLNLGDNAKELRKQVINKKAEARRKIEDSEIECGAARDDGNV
jgi:hypothetical protein